MHQKFHLWMILSSFLNGCVAPTPVPADVMPTSEPTSTSVPTVEPTIASTQSPTVQVEQTPEEIEEHDTDIY